MLILIDNKNIFLFPISNALNFLNDSSNELSLQIDSV